mmetsp:Transcript_30175/g.64489  ORF Transcript_30175/g.64489 Transcript_30175/m.64489 type:complete len:853 (-) Transcript_30175:269-2827(-)
MRIEMRIEMNLDSPSASGHSRDLLFLLVELVELAEILERHEAKECAGGKAQGLDVGRRRVDDDGEDGRGVERDRRGHHARRRRLHEAHPLQRPLRFQRPHAKLGVAPLQRLQNLLHALDLEGRHEEALGGLPLPVRLLLQVVLQLGEPGPLLQQQVARIRGGNFRNVEAGVQLLADAVQHGKGSHHEGEERREAEGLVVGDDKQVLSDVGENFLPLLLLVLLRVVGHRLGLVSFHPLALFPLLPQAGLEAVEEELPRPLDRRHVRARVGHQHAHRHQPVHRIVDVVAVNGVEEIAQAFPNVVWNLSHHSKVVEDQLGVLRVTAVHGNVARVRVRVEEPFDEDLLQVALHRVARDDRRVHPVLDQSRLVRHLDARTVLQGQHLLRGQVPVHLGHLHPGEVRKVRSEAVCVLALEPVVDLLIQNAAALVVDGHPVPGRTVRLGVHTLQQLRHKADVLRVHVEELLEVGPLDLDDDLGLAVEEHRAVDLAQARRCDGLLFQVRELLLPGGHAELLLDRLHGHLGGKGRHLVLQLHELRDELGREDVRARRKLLANLDEGWAERDQPLPQPGGKNGQLLLASLLVDPALRLLVPLALRVVPLLVHHPQLEEKDDHKAPDLDRALEGGRVLETAPPVGRVVRFWLLLGGLRPVAAAGGGFERVDDAGRACLGRREGRRAVRQGRGRRRAVAVGAGLGRQRGLRARLQLPRLARVQVYLDRPLLHRSASVSVGAVRARGGPVRGRENFLRGRGLPVAAAAAPAVAPPQGRRPDAAPLLLQLAQRVESHRRRRRRGREGRQAAGKLRRSARHVMLVLMLLVIAPRARAHARHALTGEGVRREARPGAHFRSLRKTVHPG